MLRFLGAFAAVVLLVCASASAQTTLVVNDLRDLADHDLVDGLCDADAVMPGNQCTLRAAMENANIIGGWVVIQLGSNVYPLDRVGLENQSRWGDLDVFDPGLTKLEIRGAGRAQTFIDASGLGLGGGPERILDIRNTVDPAVEIEIRSLTLTGGHAAAVFETNGGAVRHSRGKLTIDDVLISGCDANDDGGGVFGESPGELIITGSELNGNNASATGSGGGIYFDGNICNISSTDFIVNTAGIRAGAIFIGAGNVDILGSTFDSNSAANAGGIHNDATTIIRQTTFIANNVTGTGGAIHNDSFATLTLIEDDFTINSAGSTGGAISNAGVLDMSDTTINQNAADTGGGLNNTSRTCLITNSTISRNFATGSFGGAGIRGFGDLEIVNSTISGNEATNGFGGGIYWDSGLFTVNISASTIANNTALAGGAGVFTDTSLGNTPFRMISSIIADNTLLASGISQNFVGGSPIISSGHNLDTDGTCALGMITDFIGLPANLGPLQFNGGLTETHELFYPSVAVNSGVCNDLLGNPIIEDQRHDPRVGPCDIGAFEDPLPPPGNNDCPAALPIGPGLTAFDLTGATSNGPPEPCGFQGIPNLDHDLWFAFAMPCDGTMEVTLLPPSIEQMIAIYDACPPGTPGPMFCQMIPPGAAVTFPVGGFAGQQFYIRVGGFAGQTDLAALDLVFVSACTGDLNNDCTVNVADLLLMLTAWGPNPGHPADLNGDGTVNVTDLLALLTVWGPC